MSAQAAPTAPELPEFGLGTTYEACNVKLCRFLDDVSAVLGFDVRGVVNSYKYCATFLPQLVGFLDKACRERMDEAQLRPHLAKLDGAARSVIIGILFVALPAAYLHIEDCRAYDEWAGAQGSSSALAAYSWQYWQAFQATQTSLEERAKAVLAAPFIRDLKRDLSSFQGAQQVVAKTLAQRAMDGYSSCTRQGQKYSVYEACMDMVHDGQRLDLDSMYALVALAAEYTRAGLAVMKANGTLDQSPMDGSLKQMWLPDFRTAIADLLGTRCSIRTLTQMCKSASMLRMDISAMGEDLAVGIFAEVDRVADVLQPPQTAEGYSQQELHIANMQDIRAALQDIYDQLAVLQETTQDLQEAKEATGEVLLGAIEMQKEQGALVHKALDKAEKGGAQSAAAAELAESLFLKLRELGLDEAQGVKGRRIGRVKAGQGRMPAVAGSQDRGNAAGQPAAPLPALLRGVAAFAKGVCKMGGGASRVPAAGTGRAADGTGQQGGSSSKAGDSDTNQSAKPPVDSFTEVVRAPGGGGVGSRTAALVTGAGSRARNGGRVAEPFQAVQHTQRWKP